MSHGLQRKSCSSEKKFCSCLGNPPQQAEPRNLNKNNFSSSVQKLSGLLEPVEQESIGTENTQTESVTAVSHCSCCGYMLEHP